MAPVYIFAEQVRSIARSGKKEIEIPEGARISSAAADLIKEHQIQIKTVAPGRDASGKPATPGDRSTGPAGESDHQNQAGLSAKKLQPTQRPVKAPEITGEDLEEIVNRVVQRFNQLKGGEPEKKETKKADTAVKQQDGSTDSDGLEDLVICRCEEITRGEIKDAIRNGFQTLNGIKRITRAGMGLCQGQTCQRLVSRILTEELGIPAAEIDPTTARGPVRPLRLEVFANS